MGIRGTLLVAFAVVWAFVLVGSGTAIETLSQVRRIIAEVTQDRAQALTESDQIASQTERAVTMAITTARPISTVTDTAKFDQQIKELRWAENRLITTTATLHSRNTPGKAEILSLSDRIVANIDILIGVTQERLSARTAVLEAVSAATNADLFFEQSADPKRRVFGSDVARMAESDQPAGAQKSVSGQELEALYSFDRVELRTETVYRNLLAAAQTVSITDLDYQKVALRRATVDLQRDLGSLPDDAGELRQAATRLLQMVDSPDGVVSQRRRELEAIARGVTLLEDTTTLSNQLLDKVDEMVESDNRALMEGSGRAAAAAHDSIMRMVAVMLVSLICSALIVWLYVFRNLAGRLARVRDAMLRLAGGEIGIELPEERDDEVGRMAASLRVFRDTAEAAERRATALETAKSSTEAALTTLETVAGAGQEITGALDIGKLGDILYRQLSSLMELSVLYIGRLEDEAIQIVVRVEEGRRVPVFSTFRLDDPVRIAARSVREQREIVSYRGPEEAKAIALADTMPTLSAIYRPLTVGDRKLGAISVQSVREHVYSERERYVFHMLAAYAAVALDNAETYRRLAAVDTLETLGDIGQKLTATLDLERVYDILYDNLAALMDVHAFSVSLLTEGGDTMLLQRYVEDGKRLSIDVPISVHSERTSALSIREQREILREKTESEAAAVAMPGTLPMRTSLFRPLSVGEHKLGVMVVQSRNPTAYGERERRIFQVLAAYAAVAVSNASAYRRLAAVDTLQVLAKAGQEITAALEFDQVLETFYGHISSILDAQIFCVGVLSADGRTVEFPYFIDGGRKRDAKLTLDVDDPHHEGMQCIREQREIMVEQDEERAAFFASKDGAVPVHSLLFYPLTAGDRKLGVISVQSGRKHAYGERELFVFRTLASYAAIAIANADAYRRLAAIDMLEALARIGQELTSTLDFERVFETLHGHMRTMLDAQIFLIGLLDGDGRQIRYPYCIDRNRRVPVATATTMDDPVDAGALSMREQREVLIDASEAEAAFFAAKFGVSAALTVLSRPLTVGDRRLGVILVKAGRKNAYGDRERLIFRMLAAYAAVAVANADAYRTVEQSRDALNQKSTHIAGLLDNSGQGFLSFGRDLTVEPEHSRACETMLGSAPAGRSAGEVLFGPDRRLGDLLRSVVERVAKTEDRSRQAIYLSLLPTNLERQGRLLEAAYKMLDAHRIMVVLTDITTTKRLAEQAEREQRRQRLIVAAVTDGHNFFDTVSAFTSFIGDTLQTLLERDTEPATALKEIHRQVHTLKGLLAQSSFHEAPRALHALEDDLNELRQLGDGLALDDIDRVVRAAAIEQVFDEEIDILRAALGPNFLRDGSRVSLSTTQARQLEELANALLLGRAVDTGDLATRALLSRVARLGDVSLRELIQRYNWVTSQVATRLEKQVALIEVQSERDVLVDPDRFGPFIRSLVHIFRNAVAHGIEAPEVRAALGKEEAGRIRCRIVEEGNAIALTITDDGAGVDIAAIRKRLIAAGAVAPQEVVAMSEDEIVDTVFLDGISTAEHGDDISGRGVGLAAVRAEVVRLDGYVQVRTTRGQGTEFIFHLPLAPRSLDAPAPPTRFAAV